MRVKLVNVSGSRDHSGFGAAAQYLQRVGTIRRMPSRRCRRRRARCAGRVHEPRRDPAALRAGGNGHPTGYLAAGALAVAIHELVGGASLTDALAVAKICLQKEKDHSEALRAIDSAQELAVRAPGNPTSVARLGAGWTAEEALAIAIYCTLCATSFEEGVVLAVNHDGDSDSTGAIAGNLLGTMLGASAIPDCWLQRLEFRRVIEEIASDLFHFLDWHSDDPAIWAKYPGY